MKTHFFKKMLLMAVIAPLLTMVAYLATAQTPDEVAVEFTLKQQWDKPDHPLQVSPIVVVDQYAIAGWVQGERGGRALLRRSHHGWEVFMCGGDDLTKPHVLGQSGLDSVSADTLTQHLKQAEQSLTPETRKQFSIFGGVMPVNVDHSHMH